MLAQEVAGAPGIRKLRLSGELTASQVLDVASHVAGLGSAGDVVLDVGRLSSRDGSDVRLLAVVADRLAGKARLYVLFAVGPLLRRIGESGLERHNAHVRIVRHPARA